MAAKSANKTVRTTGDVAEFVNSVTDEARRNDCREVLAMMQEVTGCEPVMWGTSIVGFGSYHYKYASGREGDFMITGFSPRKRNLTLYILAGFEHYQRYMERLGKYKTGKSCLYINNLDDVDRDVLRELVTVGVKYMRTHYETTA